MPRTQILCGSAIIIIKRNSTLLQEMVFGYLLPSRFPKPLPTRTLFVLRVHPIHVPRMEKTNGKLIGMATKKIILKKGILW